MSWPTFNVFGVKVNLHDPACVLVGVLIGDFLLGDRHDGSAIDADSPIEAEVLPEGHPTIEQEIGTALRECPTAVPAGAVGSPAQDLRKKYASDYARGRKIKLALVKACEGCGITLAELKKRFGKNAALNTHHEISVDEIFRENLDPSLIGNPDNLHVFCRNGGEECHFRLGHDPDGPDGPEKPAWDKLNKHLVRDILKSRERHGLAPLKELESPSKFKSKQQSKTTTAS